LVGDLGEMVTVESMPKQEGRNMIMVISPNKRYLEQVARAQARESAAVVESTAESAEPVATAPETDEG
jgi:translation initiation factor IF-3